MNATLTTTTSIAELWKSKTDKEKRYEPCPNCHEMVLDNWFMRHVNKCYATSPNREALIEEAEKQHHNFKISLLEKVKEKLDVALEHHANAIINKPKEEPHIDVKLVAPTEPDKQMLNAFQRYTFKFGDLVEAVVTAIDKYNIVHVNMINGNPEKLGMIKNTKVRPGTVADMNEHFRVGDKIRAEVNEVRVDGKLWLSTKRFPIPTYPVFKNAPPAPTLLAEKMPEIIVKEQSIVPTLPKITPAVEDKHFEEVLTFVKSKIGIVSPEAKEKLRAMLDSKGMFTFMMALAKVADFKMDVGLVYAAEIEKQMGNQP